MIKLDPFCILNRSFQFFFIYNKDCKRPRVDIEKLIKSNPGENNCGLNQDGINGNESEWT